MMDLSSYAQVPWRAIAEEQTRRALRNLEARAPTDDLAFAQAHMRTERGEWLEFTRTRYTQAILRDERREHVVVKCAQARGTVSYLAKVFRRIVFPDTRPRTAIYTFPTATAVTEFARARAKRMIQSSPLLRSCIDDVDNVGVKQFHTPDGELGGTVYFRGTFTEHEALEAPADILVHDELDRSNMDHLQMFTDRTRESDDPHRFVFSTPTVPRHGISREWEKSDQQEWFWDCAACGKEQCFAPMDRSVSWRDQLDVEAAEFRCAHCQAPVTTETVRKGRWVAQAPDNRDIAGFHITGIMSAQADARRLVKELGRARYPERFVQGHIGLPEVTGERDLTEDMIAFGDWANTLQSETALVAGLDQGKHLDFVGGDGKGKLLSVQRFDDWAQVRSVMKTLRIKLLVADAQPEPRPLQALAAEFPGRVLLADYTLNTVERDPWQRMRNQPRIRIHRTGALDLGRDRILGGDGQDVFPALPVELEREVKAQLTAPVRTMEEDQHGNPRAVWRETGPDHFRHAHAYYCVAAEQGKRMASLGPKPRGM